MPKLVFLTSPQSPPDIRQNLDGGISDFRISGQSLIKESCDNPRTSNDIDIKLGPVRKLDKRNTATSKKFDDNVVSANCDVIVIFPIYGHLEQSDSRILDAWSVKLIFSLIVTFILQKLKTELKNLEHSFHTIPLSKATIFNKKC